MIKKSTLINSVIISCVACLTVGLGVSYSINKENNRYNAYSAIPVSSSTTDLIQAYFAAGVNGTKLLYLTSYVHTAPITTALNISSAENDVIYRYLSQMGFLLVDDQYGFPTFKETGGLADNNQPIWSTNVAAVQFRVDLGSFITGIAAAEFLNENKSYFKANEQDTLKWATFGGYDFPTVTSFMGGFQRGIKWFNENVAKNVVGFEEVQQVQLPGTNQNFTFSFEPNAGNELTKILINQHGVDLILPVAGPQIPQLTRLIKQNSTKNVVLIGVDSAIEKDQSANLPLNNLGKEKVGNNQIIQFSSVKNINVAVDTITKIINDPDLEESKKAMQNNYGGLGYSSLGNVKNGSVGVSEDGQDYFTKAMMLYAKVKNIDFNNDTNSDWNNITTNNVNESDKNNILNSTSFDYDKAISKLEQLTTYKNLDNDSEKVYVSNSTNYSYASMANSGNAMFPATAKNKEEIDKWYEAYYKTNSANTKSNLITNKTINVEALWNWTQQNKKAIQFRSQLDLKGKFTKEQYNKNASFIKIAFQSPTSVLFDKSFLESCYIGLWTFWKSVGVDIPNPPNIN